jgi:hypothetical protein
VAVKGGYVELRSSALLAVARLETAPVQGSGARLSAGLGYRHTWGAWWALGTLTAAGKGYRGVGLGITERTLGLGASGGYRWLEWALVPHVGLALELTGLRQSFLRDREAEIQDTFGVSTLEPRQALGVGAGPVAGLEVPLPGQGFALVQGQLLLRYLPSEAQASVRGAALVSAGAGWRF